MVPRLAGLLVNCEIGHGYTLTLKVCETDRTEPSGFVTVAVSTTGE